ncbi:MAG: hypothetical protein ABJL67_00800 [Sulfitobacter sp.]
MLAIGILSVLTVGFAVASSGGDEDIPDIDAIDPMLDDPEIMQGPLGIEFFAGNDLDEDDREEIDAFVQNVEDNPDQDVDDVVMGLQELFDDLGLEDSFVTAPEEAEQEAEAPETEDPETAEEEITLPLAKPGEPEGGRPPTGDEFRDPLILAEELAEQQILDDIAAEEARQPVNLVTVSESNGEEIADALVLIEGSGEGEEVDRSFVVTGPETDHDIDVRYDAEHTFLINYSETTGEVTAALNSNINGPEGTPQKSTSTTEDEEGNLITEVTWTNGFTGSTDITIDVTAEQIGEHVAQIDLLNSADNLAFEFDPEVNGNFHLFFYEAEDGEEGETSTTKRAFIVQTASTQDSLSESEVNAIAEQGAMRSATTNVLAEIYLGNDALFANAVPEEGEDPADWINDFINDNPTIVANIAWASVSQHDDGAAEAEPDEDEDTPSSGDTLDFGLGDLFGGAGPNVGFLGL